MDISYVQRQLAEEQGEGLVKGKLKSGVNWLFGQTGLGSEESRPEKQERTRRELLYFMDTITTGEDLNANDVGTQAVRNKLNELLNANGFERNSGENWQASRERLFQSLNEQDQARILPLKGKPAARQQMQRVYKAGEVAGSGLPGLKGEFQKSPKTILEGLNLGDLARRMQLAKDGENFTQTLSKTCQQNTVLAKEKAANELMISSLALTK